MSCKNLSISERAVVAQLDRATGYELVGWGFESLRPRFSLGPLALAFAVLGGCAGGASVADRPLAALPTTSLVRSAAAQLYQPLAVGDYWRYVCNSAFTITDRVIGTYKVNGHTVYALSLQIPSSPKKSVEVVELLANDSKGNTWIHGYVVHGKVIPVRDTKIVSVNPIKNQHYDFPSPKGRTISRIFMGFEYTHRTKLGTFWVAPYFESGATHNYGYNLGRGVMEQDHGPDYKYDCLIDKFVLRK